MEVNIFFLFLLALCYIAIYYRFTLLRCMICLSLFIFSSFNSLIYCIFVFFAIFFFNLFHLVPTRTTWTYSVYNARCIYRAYCVLCLLFLLSNDCYFCSDIFVNCLDIYLHSLDNRLCNRNIRGNVKPLYTKSPWGGFRYAVMKRIGRYNA